MPAVPRRAWAWWTATYSPRERRYLTAIVLVAFAVRLVWVIVAARKPIAGDPVAYMFEGGTIARGQGYRTIVGAFTGTPVRRLPHTAFYPIGYPGTLGGLFATWCTFVPCFLWIGLGAPFIERLRDNKPLNGALAGITAAVVGVILNLAIWFALHTLFGEVDERHAFGMVLQVPVPATLNVASLVLSAAAILALFRFKIGMIPTLLGCSAAGIVIHLAGGI